MSSPISAYLKNMTTGEIMEFWFNPTVLQASLDVIYDDVQVNGFMGNGLDYKRTTNFKVPIELWMNALTIARKSKLPMDLAKQALMDYRNFLLAFTAPVKTAGFETGKPPMVHFMWPGVISMQGVIRGKLGFGFKRFDLKLHSVQEIYKFTFESQNLPMYSSELRHNGMDVIS